LWLFKGAGFPPRNFQITLVRTETRTLHQKREGCGTRPCDFARFTSHESPFAGVQGKRIAPQMASNPNYVKKQITVDTVSWTAVVAPVDCMAVSIKNSVLVDLRIRTDSADSTTQDTISAGSIETIFSPRHSGGVQDGGSGSRFFAGDTIAYLQAAGGTGPVVVTFVR